MSDGQFDSYINISFRSRSLANLALEAARIYFPWAPVSRNL